MAPIWASRGVPDPSRRTSGAGRVRATPLVAAARGRGPTQPSTSVSSPRRKRWQRTPPVARPLAGYSSKGVTLTEEPVDPLPAMVTTTGAPAGSTAPNHTA